MDISLILKTIGVGVLVTVASQILQRYGRDEQATLVTVVGVVVVLVMIVGEMGDLFSTVRAIFEI